MADFNMILRGDPAPFFRQRTTRNPNYTFDTTAGRYIVLCFLGQANEEHNAAAIAAMHSRPDFFNDVTACFFGISIDPADEAGTTVGDVLPGYRWFWDHDRSVSKLYGAMATDAAADSSGPYRRTWVVMDPTLRILEVIPFQPDRSDIDRVLATLDRLPPPNRYAGEELQAPIILLPNVLEPQLCADMIALYQREGSQESGFMRERDGRTVAVSDPNHKSRRDHIIKEQKFISAVQSRILRRVVPEIAKVHQFHVTRMERYIVSCYAADDGGHFRAHRDNTTKGTAHRRFAVSVNLNDDFDGGEVCFPEYGTRSFKAPTGGAVVFSCSLLHSVSRVTRGERYAFLPFLYDDAAAKIREQNNAYLDENVGKYSGTPTP